MKYYWTQSRLNTKYFSKVLIWFWSSYFSRSQCFYKSSRLRKTILSFKIKCFYLCHKFEMTINSCNDTTSLKTFLEVIWLAPGHVQWQGEWENRFPDSWILGRTPHPLPLVFVQDQWTSPVHAPFTDWTHWRGIMLYILNPY